MATRSAEDTLAAAGLLVRVHVVSGRTTKESDSQSIALRRSKSAKEWQSDTEGRGKDHEDRCEPRPSTAQEPLKGSLVRVKAP